MYFCKLLRKSFINRSVGLAQGHIGFIASSYKPTVVDWLWLPKAVLPEAKLGSAEKTVAFQENGSGRNCGIHAT